VLHGRVVRVYQNQFRKLKYRRTSEVSITRRLGEKLIFLTLFVVNLQRKLDKTTLPS